MTKVINFCIRHYFTHKCTGTQYVIILR